MKKINSLLAVGLFCAGFAAMFAGSVRAANQWVVYDGKEGAGKGKQIVFLSGDEEYRSEEGLPQLAKILAVRHGFKCTVLFAINPTNNEIDPNFGKNIPGTQALNSADLMVILTRFRDLPDEQMKPIDDFLMAGKPVLGLRTSTHAFNIAKDKTYARYSFNYRGTQPEWEQGFGRLVLGETWISHHGNHKGEAARGLFAPGASGNPLLNGIKDGEIFAVSDVYGVRLPLPGDSKPLILGQSLTRKGPMDKEDPFFGMRPTDEPSTRMTKGPGGTEQPVNDPMMPIAWTKTYKLPGGKTGHVFNTTMGASTDLANEALRRLLVNAAYQLTGLKVPAKANVDLVGEYKPIAYGFKGFKTGVKPADHELK